LETPFRRRKSIYTHFFGTGEVLIYMYSSGAREAEEGWFVCTTIYPTPSLCSVFQHFSVALSTIVNNWKLFVYSSSSLSASTQRNCWNEDTRSVFSPRHIFSESDPASTGIICP